MATVYLSEDAGLPALTYSTTAALHRFTNFKLILKACLVTGYGAKAAAGWTLIDEGDLFIVLRNSTGKYVTFVCSYRFNSSNVAYYCYCRIYLHATYSGMSGGVPTGSGVVSGTVAGSSTPQHRGVIRLFHYAVTTRWAMFADAATFIFMSASSSVNNPATYTGALFDTSTNAPTETLYVGDDSNGYFISAGGYNTATPTVSESFSYFRATDLTVLRNPVTGLLVDTGGVSAEVVGANSPVVGLMQLSNAWSKTTLDLAPVRWVCNGVGQGYLRGLGVDPELLAHYSYAIKNMLDGTALTHTVQQILVPSVLPDGYSYQPLLACSTSRKSMMVTNNPEYW